MVHIPYPFKKMILPFLIFVFSVCLFCPSTVSAEEEHKTVRVGWFESSYNITDENGRRSGYSYEYQLKLSAYNGWTYEYVEGSWPELLEMLERGEIDLLSDVSYTEKRAEHMFFSSLPMGTEEYYIFKAPGNHVISPTESTTLNGRKIGVNKGSVQADFFRAWAEKYKVKAELIELTCSEEESLRMLESGELDAYVTVDSFLDPTCAVPVYKIGSSDYFFAVSRKRPDLLADLNFAMSRIQDENRYYNMEMFEKYIRGTGATGFLSSDETIWLAGHGKIRVGYQDNYLAFCAKDKETGELTGVLKDYLTLASDSIPNAHIDFEPIAYPSSEDALLAMKNGEVDCVFPANFSPYEAEMLETVMTPPLMNTEMYAVVRMSDPNIFAKEGQILAAVNEGNPNYEAFLADHFPDWGKVYRKTTDECLEAIADRSADCLIISNYRYNNIARKCNKLHLTTFSLGISMDYSFAVEKGQTELYSILAKTTVMVPTASVNAALSRYITEDAKLTITDYLIDHLPAVLVFAGIILLIILILLIQNMKAVKIARTLISATERDDLTGLYTRKYFSEYAERMHREHPDVPKDAMVMNIEQFHSINAIHGRAFGDQVLKALGNELREMVKERNGIAGRFEADRFDLYCDHTDRYEDIFDRLQEVLEKAAPNTNIRLRMGVMPWRDHLEPIQQIDMAQTACNKARGHYKEPLIIYNETVSERENFEHRLINHLRQALDDNEFEVYYQPKFDIQTNPPKLVSAEALIRWHYPGIGLIPPGEFIPLFEKNGQIGLLDRYVWAKAGEQIAAWRDQFGILLPVSVNLSRVDIFDPDLEETIDGIITKNNLVPGAFKLEVTESAYTESADQVIQVIENLRSRGYQVEMDDFGTGYSSLNMLSDMPIDVLKMDRGFIKNIETDEKTRLLVALILDIAKNLRVPVVAEGVETEAQLQELKKQGCAIVQGYYFSRPLPAGEFEKKYFI